MLPATNIQSIVGATLYGSDRVRLGRITGVLVDVVDGHPTWATTHVGTLVGHTVYVPLEDATWEHDDVFVAFDKDLVKSAPKVDGDEGLTPEEEQRLRLHFAGGNGGDREGVVLDRSAPDEDDRDVPRHAAR
ncbi:PRC-barrel domain-containing protein [Cnuibacter sp. UC19_7]|uniref:PRC-barrel domain-containing protein n=1 Tax=Cnuibacter sp. UC19_7 TaxID=3350166 RepID=UPI00366B9DC0